MDRLKDLYSGRLFEIVIAVLGVFFLLCGFSYMQNRDAMLDELTSEISFELNRAKVAIEKDIQGSIEDLKFISSLRQVKQALEDNTVSNDTVYMFNSFMSSKKKYDQLRLINLQGKEIFRINFNNGNPEVVPFEQLQEKSSREYVKKSFKLSEGEYYISTFDLNRENGKIELPAKSVIRFATPLYNANNQKKGILVLNVYASNYIDTLSNINRHFEQDARGFYDLFDVNDSSLSVLNSNNKLRFDYDNVYQEFSSNISIDLGDQEKITLQSNPWQVKAFIFKSTVERYLMDLNHKYFLFLMLIFLTAIALSVYHFYQSKKSALSSIERKKVEAENRELLNKSLTILNTVKDAVVTIDSSGAFDMVNPAFTKMSGYGAKEIKAKNFNELFKQADSSRPVSETLQDLLDNVKNSVEINLLTKDDVIPVQITASQSILKDAKKLTVIVLRDVRELKKMQSALFDTSEKFKAVFDHTYQFTALLDPAGRILKINESVFDFTQIDKDKLIGQYFWDSPWWKFDEALRVNIEQFISSAIEGNQISMSFHLSDNSGNDTYIDLASKPVFYNSGELNYLIVEGYDSTAQYNVVQSALSASTLKSNFLANMSHEIRTPMNGIIGLTSMLAKTEMTLQQKEHLQLIQKSGSHLLNIINNILDLSKIEAGMVELADQPVNIHQLLADLVDLMRMQCSAKALALKLNIDPSVPQIISSDPTHIRQILTNLINNAIKFTDYGTITIRVDTISNTPEKITLQFSVADTGIGMTEEQQLKIFDTYVQADRTISEKYGGTGLGLNITSRLIEMMQGRIWVESKPDVGSTFNFTIEVSPCFVAPPNPVASLALNKESEEPKPVLSENEPVSDSEVARNDLLKILVAEDNEINQIYATSVLEELGHSVNLAEDGGKAVDAYLQEEYDLILMDINMPVMDGYEATQKIRSFETSSRRTPIVALTANAIRGDREKCMESGMDGYITKPFSVDEIVEVIKQYH